MVQAALFLVFWEQCQRRYLIDSCIWSNMKILPISLTINLVAQCWHMIAMLLSYWVERMLFPMESYVMISWLFYLWRKFCAFLSWRFFWYFLLQLQDLMNLDLFLSGRIPFAFLEDIHQRFIRTYGRAVFSAQAYDMNVEFSRILSQQMEYFACDPNADRINRLKGEMSQVILEHFT